MSAFDIIQKSLVVTDAITAVINVESIVRVLGICVFATVGTAFMWWGVRKSISALMSAFKKGRVSL